MKLIIILQLVLFAAFILGCGSHDDGTEFVQKIKTLSVQDIESGLYSGKFKVEVKDRDNYTSWIYTDIEFTVGDSLVLVPFSQTTEFTELQTSNVELHATLEYVQNSVVEKDSILTALRNEVETMTDKLAEANNFKTQVKELIAEFEANETHTTVEIIPSTKAANNIKSFQ